jgi:hypothetical protein
MMLPDVPEDASCSFIPPSSPNQNCLTNFPIVNSENASDIFFDIFSEHFSTDDFLLRDEYLKTTESNSDLGSSNHQ